MPPKLYKATEVCDMAQLQPYVLRSWEKEFPGIGVQKSEETPRLYRQSDVEQVLKIKQLVFEEGLTLSGARRKLEASMPSAAIRAAHASEVIEVLGADAHKRISHVRDGLRSILHLLDGRGEDAYELTPPLPSASKARALAARKGDARGKSASRPARPPARGKSSKRVSRAR